MMNQATKKRLEETAEGNHIECPDCGETLIRKSTTEDLTVDFVEVASNHTHDCWDTPLEGAEHIRLD